MSTGKTKYDRSPMDPTIAWVNKCASGSISRDEIGNFLDKFETYILGNISEHVDILIQNKKKSKNATLSIFCPRFRKKYTLRECPLENIEICVICA